MKDRYDIDFTSTTAKMPFWDKVAWGAYSGFAFNVGWVIFGYYLMYFYTDVMGIKAAVAGSIMLFARVFDVITDPIEGYLIDNVCLKWGRYRSWPIIGIVPLALFFVGVFTAMNGMSMTIKILWATLMYGCYGAIGATVTYSASTGMLMNMTKNPQERALTASIQGVFTSLSNLVAATIFITIANTFGGNQGDEARGFFIAAIIIAIIILVCVQPAIVCTKKYELNRDGSIREHLRQSEHEPLLSQLKDLFHNLPAFIMCSGQILLQIMLAIRNGVMIYVFGYCWGLDSFYTTAVFLNSAALVVGALLLKPFIRLFRDTNRAFKAVILGNVLCSALLFLLIQMMGSEGAAASMQYGLLFVIFLINGVLLGAYNAFGTVLMLNTVDHGEYLTGKNQAGLVHACYGLSITLGSALGGFIFGFVLDGIGYVPNVAQSAATQTGLVIALFVVPAAICLLHFVLQCWYKLTDAKMAEELVEIRSRKSQEEA